MNGKSQGSALFSKNHPPFFANVRRHPAGNALGEIKVADGQAESQKRRLLRRAGMWVLVRLVCVCVCVLV